MRHTPVIVSRSVISVLGVRGPEQGLEVIWRGWTECEAHSASLPPTQFALATDAPVGVSFLVAAQWADLPVRRRGRRGSGASTRVQRHPGAAPERQRA